MARLVDAAGRHGAPAAAVLAGVIALAIFGWMLSVTAAALDSVLVAFVLTTTVLLAPAYSVATLARPRRR
jgi:hypothetical protein